MSTTSIPEHIHALPRRSTYVVLPEAVAVWDVDDKKIYVGDGSTPGGIEVSTNSNADVGFITVSSCENNKITINSKNIPIMLKTNTGKFYSIRGEDISIENNQFKVDISNALAVNNLSEFTGDWFVYIGGKAID